MSTSRMSICERFAAIESRVRIGDSFVTRIGSDLLPSGSLKVIFTTSGASGAGGSGICGICSGSSGAALGPLDAVPPGAPLLPPGAPPMIAPAPEDGAPLGRLFLEVVPPTSSGPRLPPPPTSAELGRWRWACGSSFKAAELAAELGGLGVGAWWLSMKWVKKSVAVAGQSHFRPS